MEEGPGHTGEAVLSIVTPSYNMFSYLPLCCASVADQGLLVEHIVMDGGSTDGTVDWLARNLQVISFSEKDEGMYDALNKAIARTRTEIIGHLNCDEQYLPGTLGFVKQYFDSHPDVDFITGNFLVIDKNGELVAYRKSFQPRWPYFFSNYLYTTTCTLFYRRKIFNQCKFDKSYKSIADVVFLYDVIRKGFRGAHVNQYFSVFVFSGENLSLQPVSAIEKSKFNKTLPIWFRILKPVYFLLFFMEKIIHGNYREKAMLSYSIFTKKNILSRTSFTSHKPGFRLRFK